MQTEIEKRWDEFRRESTDAELQWTHHAHTVLQWFLRFAFGEDEAVDILERHFAAVGSELEGEFALYAPSDWMTYAPEKIRRLHIYKQLANLRAYAFYGLPVEDLERHYVQDGVPENEAERLSCIENLLAHFLPFKRGEYLISPISLFGEDIAPVVDASSARWKLDAGDNNDKLTLTEVAAVARMGLKSVKNATLSKSNDPLVLEADGRVRRGEAYRWLLNRRDFRDSVWRDSNTRQGASVAGEVRMLGQVVFVPVARDGNFFSPAQHCDGVYRVGPPVNPGQYRTFEDALDALQRMEEPRWHVPTLNGWMVVTGVQWIRVPRAELEASQPVATQEDEVHV